MTRSKIHSLSMILALVLLLGSLASCGGDDPDFKFSRKLEPLTDEQIEECNEAYRISYFGSLEEYLATKSDNMREQAEKIYYGMKFIQNNAYTPYLGTFSGTIVVGSSITQEEESYTLGSHKLEMGSLKKITVYKDGKFVTISQAYNSGWITDTDVQMIEERIALYLERLAK